MKINQQHITGIGKIIFCILLLLMAFCCGYAQCNTAINIALNKPATASSLENAGYPAGNAFDGNIGTRWSSAYTDNEYIYVDLGSSYPLCSVALAWENAYGKNFTIDISTNASAWTTVATVTGNSSLNNSIPISGTARYVRMKGTLRATGYGYSLYEFQVFSTNASPVCPTPNAALGKAGIISSLENAVFGAANAFDGNPATRWSSAFSDPQSIYVDLGTPYSLCSVDLSWEAAYATNFEIDGSNNAITWTTLSSITGNASITNSIPVSGSYRYVRMYGTARATGFGYSLYEFSVHGSAILPIEITDFSAHALEGGLVGVSWRTGPETTGKIFEIQRSPDGVLFAAVGSVSSGEKPSSADNYFFSDPLPHNGTFFYRLKQTNQDGESGYSNIVQVTDDTELSAYLVLAPNPVTSSFGLKGAGMAKGADLCITDVSGHLLKKLSGVQLNDPISVSDLSPGIYFVSVRTASRVTMLKLLKR